MYRAHFFRRVNPGSAVLSCVGGLLSLALALALPVVPAHGAAAPSPKVAAPQELDLDCPDGLELKATYLPGARGKDTVPFILLHGYEESRKEYANLAKSLQSLGHAVLVPDLRGHGASVNVKNYNRELKASTMPGSQFARMVTVDMEQLNQFLLARNNAGELNIDKLCVVGSEMGAVVGLNWILFDWGKRPYPTFKNGRAPKAAVLISPKWSFRGLNLQNVFKHPWVRSKLAVMILVGSQSRAVSDAKRIHKMFEAARDKDVEPADRDLFLYEYKTKLDGTELLNYKTFKIESLIGLFGKTQLLEKSYPWTDRTSPLDKINE